MEHHAKQSTYQGEPAIELKFGDYSAIMLPGIGGNLIALRNDAEGWQILREPTESEFAEFKANPMVHGIPVLLPPNRFDGGRFTFEGRTYQFPINEPETGNSLHGFVAGSPWDVVDYGSDTSKSYVTVSIKFDQHHPAFAYYPHVLTLTNAYTLNAGGLTQTFSAVNEGGDVVPFMIGYHTAINAPFVPGSTVEDLDVGITFGERWELSDRMLPTGRKQPLLPGEEALKAGKGNPYFADMDNHYTAEPQNGRNAMTVTDNKAKVRLVYDAGLKYGQWMVWNNRSNGKFFCPEPQTNLVNAPNSALPADQTGLIALKPGETWSETSRFYVERI